MREEPRIVVLMDRLSWKQPRMAEYLCLNQGTVSRMANGAPESGPTGKLLDQLALEHGHPDLTAERFAHTAPAEKAAAS